MNHLKHIIFITFLFLNFSTYGQNTDQVKKRGPADEYSRNSVSYVLLEFPDNRFNDYLKKAVYKAGVPSKFDYNDIKEKVYRAPYYHTEQPNLKKNAEAVRRSLSAEKYANKIVKFWWNIDDEGNYSTDIIQKRGFYNATDWDVEKADAEKRGRAALADAGEKLIAKSYVLVLDFHDIKTMKEIYDAQDAKAMKLAKKLGTEFTPVERKKNGFTGKLTAYLFKVNYSDTVQGYFMDAFIDEQKIDLQKLDNIFQEVYSPLTYITQKEVTVDGTQANPGQFLAPAIQKTKEQLMAKLVNDGINKVFGGLEKTYEEFRVKTPLVSTHPLQAKIGKKEGLTHERKFFVWEYVANNKGNVVAKKRGEIRAQKVVDNRNDELGQTQTSIFYQIGGHRLNEGMTLQERKDAGIGISGGFSFIGGGFVHGDINVGQWLDIPIKQFKLYGDLYFRGKDLIAQSPVGTMPITEENYSFSSFSIGIQKEYPFARNYHFGWFVGWTGESVSWTDMNDGESLSASGINWGLQIGANLFSPSVQLIMRFNGHNYGSLSYTADNDTESVDTGINMSDMFPDRRFFGTDLSLRINF